MTGEVTLRGNVLPIGGLREKSLAANRAGISKIIFPKGNVRDLDEVPAAVREKMTAVREKMTYVPVENMSQVLKEAMVR